MPLRLQLQAVLLSLLAAWGVFSQTSGLPANPADGSAISTASITTGSPSSSAGSISVASGASQATITTTGTSITSGTGSPSSPVPSDASRSSTPSPTTEDTESETPIPNNGAFAECRDPSGPFAPFCQPVNGSEVWVGDIYYVTWDSSRFAPNSTITLELNYANPEPNAGPQAWHSAPRRNSYGFAPVTMDGAWLKDLPRNNLTFYIVEMDPTSNSRSPVLPGPTVSLIKKPVSHPTPHAKPAPSRVGLLVGLPVTLGVMALVLCGLFFGMRKKRRLGVGNVMGRRRGYGVGQSRRQRMKRAGRRGGLDDDDDADMATGKGVATEEGFRDEPIRGMELEERRAGASRPVPSRGEDLIGSPTEDRTRDDPGRHDETNVFRDEVERQRRRGV